LRGKRLRGVSYTVGGTSTDEFDFCTLLFGGSPLADLSRILARDSSHPTTMVLVRNLGVKIRYEISLTIYETVSRKSSPLCLRGKRLRDVS